MHNASPTCGENPLPAPNPAIVWRRCLAPLVIVGVIAGIAPRIMASDDSAAERFVEEVEPVLIQYCYDCHGMAAKKGGVSLDEFANGDEAVQAKSLWHKVLKNVRAGIMPPPGKPRPTAEESKV